MSYLTDKVSKLIKENIKNFEEFNNFKLFRNITGNLTTAGGIGIGAYAIAKDNPYVLAFAAGSLTFSAIGDFYALYRQKKAARKTEKNRKEIETYIELLCEELNKIKEQK